MHAGHGAKRAKLEHEPYDEEEGNVQVNVDKDREEQVKVEEDEVVTKAVVKLQKKFSERVLTGAADSWKK